MCQLLLEIKLMVLQDLKKTLLQDSVVDAGKKAPEVDGSKALDNVRKNDQVPRSEVESLFQQERQTENINILLLNTLIALLATEYPIKYPSLAFPLNLPRLSLELEEYINSPSSNRHAFYDDDDDEYSIQVSEFLMKSPIAIAPVLPSEDPENSLNDIRFIEQLLYDDTSSEDDSFKDIDYVEASPLDFELVSLEEVKDEILRAKLLNIHLLIAKIEWLNNNPTPDCMLKSPSSSFLSYTDNSSPEFETFSYYTEDTSRCSTTTHANNSLPEYDLFLFEIEPDQGETIFLIIRQMTLLWRRSIYFLLRKTRYHRVLKMSTMTQKGIFFLKELLRNDSLSLPEFESFHFDLYDKPSSSRPSDKPADDGDILTTKVVDDISDNSTNDPLVEEIDLFLASENSIPPEKPADDGDILTTKVVDDISDNSTRELYVHVLNVLPSLPTLYKSHRGVKVFQLVNNYESPMMIYGENIPHLDVLFLYFYPP
nr:hypothetical protein [Tanacetum cinerariifolium]